GARREAVITTKQDERKRYRVRARGSSVLLGSLDGDSDETLELVWSDEKVLFGQVAETEDEPMPEDETSKHPTGFQGHYSPVDSIRISQKTNQCSRFTFRNPFGAGDAVVYLSLKGGRFMGFIQIGDSGWQGIQGRVTGGHLTFTYENVGRTSGEVTCILRSKSRELSVAFGRHFGSQTIALEDLSVMSEGISVVLMATGPKKIEVIKTLRLILGLDLKDAKHMADNCPVEVKTGLHPSEASKIAHRLWRVGAKAKIV
ncbi:MAG: 50S ribosomal protein L7/L12, partial [Myxococcota bacterium]|nr:50S ribosomal protein L7/L12 [Myxococcota bacterium]